MSTENETNIKIKNPNIIMSIKHFVKDNMNKLSAYAKKNRDERAYKKALINAMTIQEKEKVYKSYINPTLVKQITDPNNINTKIEVKLTPAEIKRSISWRVSTEQIQYIVPRLKEGTKQ